MPPTLNGTDISARHRYLSRAWPDWSGSLTSIRNAGGPWKCAFGHASLLVYRCSICGKEL